MNKASILCQKDEHSRAMMNDNDSQRQYNESPEITSVRAELDHQQINNEILDVDSNIKRSICSSEESV